MRVQRAAWEWEGHGVRRNLAYVDEVLDVGFDPPLLLLAGPIVVGPDRKPKHLDLFLGVRGKHIVHEAVTDTEPKAVGEIPQAQAGSFIRRPGDGKAYPRAHCRGGCVVQGGASVEMQGARTEVAETTSGDRTPAKRRALKSACSTACVVCIRRGRAGHRTVLGVYPAHPQRVDLVDIQLDNL